MVLNKSLAFVFAIICSFISQVLSFDEGIKCEDKPTITNLNFQPNTRNYTCVANFQNIVNGDVVPGLSVPDCNQYFNYAASGPLPVILQYLGGPNCNTKTTFTINYDQTSKNYTDQYIQKIYIWYNIIIPNHSTPVQLQNSVTTNGNQAVASTQFPLFFGGNLMGQLKLTINDIKSKSLNLKYQVYDQNQVIYPIGYQASCVCPLYCIQCDDNKCLVCQDGYFLDASNTCVKCNPSCQACDQSGCLTCQQPSYYISVIANNYCVSDCDTSLGLYVETSSVTNSKYCKKCNTLCQSCTDSTLNCVCKLYSSQDQCVNTCQASEVQLPNNSGQLKCYPCDLSCSTCNGIGKTQCTKCNTNYLNQISTSLCVKTCDSSEYPDYNLNQCLPCDKTCLTCNGPSNKQCLKCKDGNFFFNGTCVQICPNGYQKNFSSFNCDLSNKLIQQYQNIQTSKQIANLCIIGEDVSKNSQYDNSQIISNLKTNLVANLQQQSQTLPQSSLISTYSNKVIAQLQQSIITQSEQQKNSIYNQVQSIIINTQNNNVNQFQKNNDLQIQNLVDSFKILNSTVTQNTNNQQSDFTQYNNLTNQIGSIQANSLLPNQGELILQGNLSTLLSDQITQKNLKQYALPFDSDNQLAPSSANTFVITRNTYQENIYQNTSSFQAYVQKLNNLSSNFNYSNNQVITTSINSTQTKNPITNATIMYQFNNAKASSKYNMTCLQSADQIWTKQNCSIVKQNSNNYACFCQTQAPTTVIEDLDDLFVNNKNLQTVFSDQGIKNLENFSQFYLYISFWMLSIFTINQIILFFVGRYLDLKSSTRINYKNIEEEQKSLVDKYQQQIQNLEQKMKGEQSKDCENENKSIQSTQKVFINQKQDSGQNQMQTSPFQAPTNPLIQVSNNQEDDFNMQRQDIKQTRVQILWESNVKKPTRIAKMAKISLTTSYKLVGKLKIAYLYRENKVQEVMIRYRQRKKRRLFQKQKTQKNIKLFNLSQKQDVSMASVKRNLNQNGIRLTFANNN
ncbi:transmembrane protein, putative (macronuclear) [Tetrahymena thermophila SB210]|uniref:Transmembrane protein, putative n=1 Tax=Tetrahymena thermophila (strain SB210) TaxID=312017 RepID=I7MEX3_TETTS|nr:transmembrane protein, putative [Tetrahymena thermophila SB210]EAR97972.2 transmembrane protein, putative [Tetrahymena thermophila SB210]|eukprot:XP_001018217.2 transmembrane protein, putative [Tetrahymena thermophila SB210]